MDLYTYVASCNPYQAKAILHKYGYSTKDANNLNDLGICLKKLVAYEGQDAFHDILDSHPDKGVIVERYSSDSKSEKSGCSCGDKCGCKSRELQYMNFNGGEAQSSKSVREVSLYILSAALLLAAAIISKK
jgi:hypothetical protein